MKTRFHSLARRPGKASSLIAAAVLVATTMGATGAPRAARQDPADCSTDSSLCLQEGRFLISATWKKPDGSSGAAHAVRLTPDSGYFWFLEPDNVEVAVKTLDGCSINGRYWFFSGGLTNLEVSITVADMVSGRSTTYSNPQGTAFKPVVDMSSLSSCPAVGTTLSARSPEEPPESDLTAASVAPHAVRRSTLELGCAETDSALCISGRFQVEATWQSAAGRTGTAHAVSLTSESGYFWFFDESNVELLVKTLDACGLGRGQWFFAAGMTTVGVQMKVTDTFTGEIRTYANALGASLQPIQDTSAFSFCPTPTPTSTPIQTPTPTPTPTQRPSHTPLPTRTPHPPTPTPAPGLVHVYECRNNCFNGRFSFSPSTVHVPVGGSISWVFDSFRDEHSTTSGSGRVPDGTWDSGAHYHYRFTHVFPQAGTFHYFCTVHHETGTVVVDP
jgi:plastocyanin